MTFFYFKLYYKDNLNDFLNIMNQELHNQNSTISTFNSGIILNRDIHQWISDYGVSHQNPMNKKIHWDLRPLSIMFTLLGLLSLVKIYNINLTHLIIIFALFFYLRLSISISGWYVHYFCNSIRNNFLYGNFIFRSTLTIYLFADFYNCLGRSVYWA